MALFVAASAGCGSGGKYGTLAKLIADREGRVAGAQVAVYVKDLSDESSFSYRADSQFHAASTMKVPVMIEYFRALGDGRIAANATIKLENSFTSIVDTSHFALDSGEDSDSAMYGRVGQEVPVRELVERMITRSSNLATNAVIALVGAPAAQATARALGAKTINVRRGVEDDKAFAQGLNNTTSAKDLGALMEAIVTDRAANPEATKEMLAILERQEFNDEIPAGLPAGTRVAHKTGQISGVLHDAAIVFPPEGRAPFVLIVLTRNIPDEKQARAIIQDVARYVWDALIDD